ncbi:MAG: type II toxin-antitoxin system PemK/MazF family toxin, partial [Cyanobium sp.]
PRNGRDPAMTLARDSLVLVDLEPTRGHEQRGTRPCLVVSDPAVNASQRSIDKQRIRRSYGQVIEAELAAVDAGLRLYLGLEPDPG